MSEITFHEGDTVTKINSTRYHEVPDGEIGIVRQVGSELTSVLFVGRSHDILVLNDDLELMYPISEPQASDPQPVAGDNWQERALKAEASLALMVEHEVAARQLLIDDGAISQSSFTLEELVNQLLDRGDYQKAQKEAWKVKSEKLQAQLAASERQRKALAEAGMQLVKTLNDYALDEARENWDNTNVEVAIAKRDAFLAATATGAATEAPTGSEAG